MKKHKADRIHLILLIVISVYALSIIKFQHVRFTADSMLYLSIAHKYLRGDFANAVNGYWGPLLAWLLVPFLSLGATDIAALNMVNLVVGITAFVTLWRLSYRFEMSEGIRSVVLITSLPVITMISLVQPMDFLLLCLLILYLNVLFRENYGGRLLHGVSGGVFGACAYLTKAYAFPFFIVHYFVMNILHATRRSSHRRQIAKVALAGFTVFFLISGAWIYVISSKYGHFTFSTMRDTNFNAPEPGEMGGGLEFGVPVFYEGFFEPPNETAFVIWEDPSYLRGNAWSPFESPELFRHFIRLVLKNISQCVKILASFSFFSVTIIFAFILLLTQKTFKEMLSDRELLYPLLTIALYSGGYLLFHLEERYLWPVDILILLMGGHLVHYIFGKDFFKRRLARNIIVAFFVLSFIFEPSRYIAQAESGNVDVEMYRLGNELKEYNIRGNIASNREIGSHEAWHKTFRLAYWLGCRYYGQRGEHVSDEGLEKELARYNIDYYFLWGEKVQAPQFLSTYKEITHGEVPGLSVYSLKERK